MKVILLEDIEAVGKMGDTVNVKDGYARNYLIPRKLALLATARNLKAQDHQIKHMERRKTKIAGEAQSLADKITGVSLSFTRKTGEKGRLFGSVTNMDIAAALKEKGLNIDRKDIILPEPIKSLGEFDIEIKLHHDITPTVKITVLPEDGLIPEGAMEEAPAQEAAPESPEAEEAPAQEAAPESPEAVEEETPVEEEVSEEPAEEKE
jgi:large subunit ribosomal protein L9